MGDFYVLDTENREHGGKVKEEKMMQKKKTCLGNAVRKSLSDVTNSQNLPTSPGKDGNRNPTKLISTKEYVEQLRKENVMLMKLLADRNKIIELTGAELAKMKINLQKVQQQNWQLAQANSYMLAELNLGKDKLKALHHELGCKVALLSVKDLELQEKGKKKVFQKTQTDDRCENSKGDDDFLENCADNNKSIANRRRQSRSLSLGSSTVGEQRTSKEKGDDKSSVLRKQSVNVKSGLDHTEDRVNNKRLCLRRQSSRFKSKGQEEPTEDLFEIEDANFAVRPQQDDLVKKEDAISSSAEEGKEQTSTSSCDTPSIRRSSIGRPTRKAAEKIQSYKEMSVKVKMRRSE
ncbi:hypothetical protein Sjap_013732 [Stephania japonica]|uniref:Shugoshin C-terminal domain-containing protein n=1 Tax=Stephania japonica TaxID=461633 RepID=A0AAP0IZ91_9MAGN